MTTIADADQVADTLLPLDGPYDPDAVAETARAVAELIRRLNHATFSGTALRYPSHVYRVLSALTSAVYGLDQTLRQLANRLNRYSRDAAVGHDAGEDPTVACLSAADELRDATAHLAGVRAPIQAATQITSHLKLDDSPPTRPRARAFFPLSHGSPAADSAQHSPPTPGGASSPPATTPPTPGRHR